MADTKTWFTKTVAREAITALSATLLEDGEISPEVKAQLDGLFAGKVAVSNTMVRNEEGEVVMKRCSYFGLYLPISEFGTVGKDDQGNQKFSYQSKAGASAARKTKTELENALNDANEALEADEDIQAWKQAKADAITASEVKAEYEGDEVAYATYEDALEAIA